MRSYLVKLRKSNKLTQQNVADKIRMSAQYYQMIEVGKRQKNIDVSTLTKLSCVFNVELVYLIECETKYQKR